MKKTTYWLKDGGNGSSITFDAELVMSGGKKKVLGVEGRHVSQVKYGRVWWSVEGLELPNNVRGITNMFYDAASQLLLLKHQQGLLFLRVGDHLQLLGADNRFHDAGGWAQPGNSIHVGRIYSDPSVLGLCTFHKAQGVRFYGIFKDNPKLQVLDITYDDDILSSSTNTEIYLADLKGEGIENVVVRHAKGTAVYKFNNNLGIDKVLDIPDLGTDLGFGVLKFSNITLNPYLDLLFFNTSGLFVYEHSEAVSTYRHRFYHPYFSKKHGWQEEQYKSITSLDLDGDGSEELMLTGPQGLDVVFIDVKGQQLISMLDATSLNPGHRYATVVHADSAGMLLNYPGFITQVSLHPYPEETEVHTDVQDVKLQQSAAATATTTSAGVPTVYPKHSGRTRNLEVLLKNQLDHSFLMNAVDHTTGKLKLTLPLVQIPNSLLQLTALYDDAASGMDEVGVLGAGWILPQSYIFLDHRNSNFEEDHVYYISFEGVTLMLEPEDQKTTKLVQTFTIKDLDILKIEYLVTNETWLVKNKSNKIDYKFGGENVRRDVKWENWMGEGYVEAADKQRHVTVEWYLSETLGEHGSRTVNRYNRVEVPVTKKTTFTKEIYLVETMDDQDNRVHFSYETKQIDSNSSPVNTTGKVRTTFTNNKYLTGYTLVTPNYEQKIRFEYKANGTRLLSAISQNAEEVLRFEYHKSKNEFLLEKVTMSSGLVVEYERGQVGQELTTAENTGFRYSYHKQYSVDYHEVIWISRLTEAGQVEVMTLDKDQLVPTKALFPLVGKGSAVKFSSVLTRFYYSAILSYSTSLEICTFWVLKQDETLNTQHCFDVSDKTVVRFGKDFIVVKDSQEAVEVIEWDNEKKLQVKRSLLMSENTTSATQRLIATFHNRILVYDDETVYLYYKRSGNWVLQPLKETTGFISGIQTFLNKFEMSDEARKIYFKNVVQNMLHMDANSFQIATLVAEENKLSTRVYNYVINSNHEVVHESVLTVLQDTITNTTCSNCVLYDDDNEYHIGYSYRQDQYRMSVNKIVDRHKKPVLPKEAMEEFVRTKIGLNRILLDFQKYLPHPTRNGLVVGDKRIVFSGSEWVAMRRDSKPDSGDDLTLTSSTPESSITLMKGSQTLHHLKLTDWSKVQNRLPQYFVYEGGAGVRLVEMSERGTVERIQTLPVGEQISAWTGHDHLVTEGGAQGGRYIIVRPRARQLVSPNTVVTRVQTHLGDTTRTIEYGYEEFSRKYISGSIYYDKVVLVPGGNKTKYGWVEYEPGQQTVYDGNGQARQVKHSAKEKKGDKDTDKKSYAKNVLKDKRGRLDVATFSVGIPEEETSYFGFEDYEVNKINLNQTVSKGWQYNTAAVIHHGFSFTGGNVLQLRGDLLSGIFRVRQNGVYMSACWVKGTSGLNLGGTTPVLKLVLFDSSRSNEVIVLGKVKLLKGSWVYIEATLDVARTINLLTNSVETTQPDLEVLVDVQVRSVRDEQLYVDHVRFHPFDSQFEGKTYNHLGQTVDTLMENGFVTKNFYDEYGKNVAATNEMGELIMITTYSRGPGMKSEVQILPETGWYNQFDTDSLTRHWIIADTRAWVVSPGTIKHKTVKEDVLTTRSNITQSYGARFRYSLHSSNANLLVNEVRISVGERLGKSVIGGNGEVMIIRNEERRFLWLDGVLVIDDFTTGLFKTCEIALKVTGEVTLSDVFVFEKPAIQVSYYNMLNEKVQELQFESSTSVLVREYLLDELGRGGSQTKWVRVTPQGPLLSHRPLFVTNKLPQTGNSLWDTGKTEGEINRFDETSPGYGFKRVKYANNPLDEVVEEALPGREFAIAGPFSIKYSSKHDAIILESMYPRDKGYEHKTQLKPGNVEEVTVVDDNGRKMAVYKHAPNKPPTFSSYEYDKQGNLITMLPPTYHETAKTFLRINNIQGDLDMQNNFGSHSRYDHDNRVLWKKTPDTGKKEYLYDQGVLQYLLQYDSIDSSDEIKSITAFEYDDFGRFVSSGVLQNKMSREELLQFHKHNNMTLHQQYFYNDFELEPLLRGRVQRMVTYNMDEPLAEEMVLDSDGNVINKSLLLSLGEENILRVAISKKYKGRLLHEIEYPSVIQGKPLILRYTYDRLGQMVGIYLKESPETLLEVTYAADGHVDTETHIRSSKFGFMRKYSYNAPGFLTSINDKFMTENLSYTAESYGGPGYGDGTVTKAEFEAKWHDSARPDLLKLHPNSFVSPVMSHDLSRMCFDALKKRGYINTENHQEKLFYPRLAFDVPLACVSGLPGRKIQEKLGRDGFPQTFGHIYDYGNDQEMVKAKYFVGASNSTNNPRPLQPDTFTKEIPGLTAEESKDIWDKLNKSKFLVQDTGGKATNLPQAKKRKTIIRESLESDLKKANVEYVQYSGAIRRLLMQQTATGNTLNFSKFEKIFQIWNHFSSNHGLGVWKVLESQRYVTHPLAEEFKQMMEPYKTYETNILRVLFEYVGSELGEAEFDVESYEIDANGNHRKFYAGFNRFELTYTTNTNKVHKIKIHKFSTPESPREYVVDHDHRGNIIRAPHKGINLIQYDHVFNRATNVTLVDGRSIMFYYDSKGERVLKRVFRPDGTRQMEVHYFRDSDGRSLVERKLTYITQNQAPDLEITSYIYGPRGLVGFFRGNQYYSVLTDHQGSVRLVVKAGEVVAAYDYMPYGKLMRKYVSYPEADIAYLFTGQEWDEEMQLYNFHARLYDPDVGRFLQVDPKEQYFSPYKYAGNSPISMVDPDGELALLLIAIGFAVVGAYLGGAAANKDFNFLNWKYNKANTWVGIVLGGVGGFVAPYGAVASVGVLTTAGLSTGWAVAVTGVIGAGAGYLNIATSMNNTWNPVDWNWKSPELWNAAFVGVGTGTSLIGGFGAAKTSFLKLSRNGRIFFGAATVTGGSTVFVLGGFSNNWDFTKPGMYSSILQAMTIATDIPVALIGGFKFLQKNGRLVSDSFVNIFESQQRLANQGRYAAGTFSTIGLRVSDILEKKEFFTMIKGLAKSTLGPISIGAGAYLLGSLKTGSWSWEMKDTNTYIQIIDSLLTVRNFASGRKIIDDIISRRKAAKFNKKSEALNIEARKAVKISNDIYMKWIKEGAIELDPKYFSMVLRRLTAGQIPNTTVSVGFLKKHLIVTYSTADSPGMIYIFERNKLGNPMVKKQIFLKHNADIDGPIVLHPDVQENVNIHNAIESTQAAFIKDNSDNFQNRKVELLERLDPNLPTQVKESLIRDIERTVAELGHVPKETLKDLVVQHYRNNVDGIKEQLQRQIDDLRTGPQQDKAAIARQIQMKHKDIQKLQDLKTQEVYFSSKVNPTITEISNVVGSYKERLTTWDPTNCAEPRVVTTLARWDAVIGHPKSPYKYLTSDIKYLATYKVPLREGSSALEFVPRCGHCVQTTASVRHVISDPDWLSLHITENQNRINRARERLQKVPSEMYFFQPRQWPLGNLTHNNTRTKREVITTKGFSSNPSDTPSWTIYKPDVNSALFLLDVLIRKITGGKYVGRNGDTSLADVTARALCITEKFSDAVRKLKRDENHTNQLDLSEFHRKVYKSLATGRGESVPNLIKAYASKLGIKSQQIELLLTDMLSEISQSPSESGPPSSGIHYTHLPGSRLPTKHCSQLPLTKQNLLF